MDYSLDFGKLAYIKIQDLTSRLSTLENKNYDNFTTIYFNRKNLVVDQLLEKQEFINCGQNTDLSFSLIILTSANLTVNVLLDNVFLFSENIAGGGEKTLNFEARGITIGQKILSISFLGSGQVLRYDLSVSGNKVAYFAGQNCLSHAQYNQKDYILSIKDGVLQLFYVQNEQLVTVFENMGSATFCKAYVFDNKLFLFYTVWDKTLYFSVYDGANKTAPKQLFFDVDALSCAQIQGMLCVYFIKNAKMYFSLIFKQNQNYFASDVYLLSNDEVLECDAASQDSKIYLVSTNSQGRGKLQVSSPNLIKKQSALNIFVQRLGE